MVAQEALAGVRDIPDLPCVLFTGGQNQHKVLGLDLEGLSVVLDYLVYFIEVLVQGLPDHLESELLLSVLKQ